MHRFIQLAFISSALAVDTPVPGHSHQGHAFNEGPRQEAVLLEGMGDVHLPITTDWSEGQVFFDQGLGQLHGFWYFEAERSFRQIAAKDPECAMAYWGMAMANWENEKRAKGFIEKAVALMEGASTHERKYIEAQANFLDGEPKDLGKRRNELLRDLEEVVHSNPEDIEAKAFLVVRLWQFSRKGIAIPSPEAVDALLQQILAKSPMHPAHHYRIHLWDKRKAERALDSAAKLGFTAPGIAHMWHMPGHIYSDLHRYEDAAWHQQASARIDHAHMIEHRLLPDQIHNYAHNNEWLARNWVHLGNAAGAKGMAMSLLANPRHPKLNTMAGKAHSFKYGRQRLLEVLEKFEMWEEVIGLSKEAELEVLGAIEHDLPRLRLIGLAHHHLDQSEGLNRVLAEVDGLLDEAKGKVEAAREKARQKAGEEKKGAKEREKMVKAAGRGPGQKVEQLKRVRAELVGCQDEALGRTAEALEALKKGKRPKYALSLRCLELGDREAADAMSADAVKAGPGEALPLAARIEVLHRLERNDEAIAAFGKLRKISSQVDLEVAPFARLGPIAEALGLPSNWKLAYVAPEDFGDRPEKDALGPLHWSPPSAPSFSLPDQDRLPVSLRSYRERPLILIHYLGHGCLHCAEQLNALAERVADFEAAGLPILAVSTDSIADLKKSQANYSSGGSGFPFPLLADPEKKVFRSYGTFDDFEGEALHGTFLIGPSGRLLWSDIAADPFMDLDFLLKESARLLEIHAEAESGA